MRRTAFALLLLLAACGSDPEPAPSSSPTPSPSASATFEATESTVEFGDPASLAFDAKGDLWVGNYETRSLARYAPAALAASGVPDSETVIVDPALAGPNALAFDSQGWAWLPIYGSGSVVGFSPADLAAGRKPSVVIQPGDGTLVQPGGVAFDKAGNLWVSNASAGHLVRFPAATLRSGKVEADVVLDVPDEKCQGVLVDPSGNVWQSCAGTDRLYVYAAATVAKSGAPKPARTVQWGGSAICGPTLMTLHANAVWVACYEAHAAVALPLTASGTPAETARISGVELTGVHGIAFDKAGRLWLGTNLNAILRVDTLTTGPVRPAVVLRSR